MDVSQGDDGAPVTNVLAPQGGSNMSGADALQDRALRFVTLPEWSALLQAVPEQARVKLAGMSLAVGETVILMAPPSSIPIETPDTGRGGCSRLTALAVRLRHHQGHRLRPAHRPRRRPGP